MDAGQSPTNTHTSTKKRPSSPEATTLSAEVPSQDLDLFLPVVLVAETKGVLTQFTVEFSGEVKFPPFNGPYGNLTTSLDAQQYV